MRMKNANVFFILGGTNVTMGGGLKIFGIGGQVSKGVTTSGWGGVSPSIPPILDNPEAYHPNIEPLLY